MKTRLQLISEYKLLGLDEFIKLNQDSGHSIIVVWDGDNGCATPESEYFENAIQDYIGTRYVDNVVKHHPSGLCSSYESVTCEYWIVLIFDYIDKGASVDKYIWIS